LLIRRIAAGHLEVREKVSNVVDTELKKGGPETECSSATSGIEHWSGQG
jgi:hypothetical protein